MLPDAIYTIDHLLLATWHIPVPLRVQPLMGYLNVLVGPFITLYHSFGRFRAQKLYDLAITPQVCYLEKLLNDRYDLALRRIVIVDSVMRPSFYLYNDAELKPQYLYTDGEGLPVYVYTDGETQTLFDDFLIEVPAGIVFGTAEMKSLVKAFCLPGKKFKIVIV